MSAIYTRTENIHGDGNAAKCMAEFDIRAVRNNFRSQQEGRDIWEDREYITIFIPGDAKTVVEREATAEDKARFAREYNGWKEAGTNIQDGTPLKEWTRMTPALVRMLNSINIFTVDQLAGLVGNDAKIQNIGMGGRALVDEAAAWIASAKDTSVISSLRGEVEQLKALVSTLEKNNTELKAALDAVNIGSAAEKGKAA